MIDNDIAKSPEAHFSAVLLPHRSLGRKGFIILMGVISLVSFITGIAFYMQGAWPVLGFFGLDVLLIYGAFRLNYRAARLRETIELTQSEAGVAGERRQRQPAVSAVARPGVARRQFSER